MNTRTVLLLGKTGGGKSILVMILTVWYAILALTICNPQKKCPADLQ